MMMKIGFDAKRLFNNRTGLGNYSRTLLDYLLLYYPEHEYHLFTPNIGIKEYFQVYNSYSNVKIHTADGENGILWRTFKLSRLINDLKLDVYHGLSHELPRTIAKTQCRKIVTIHDVIYKSHPEYFPFIDRLFYHLKFKHSITSADKVIAISQNTKKEILKHFDTDQSKIDVIYNAISPEMYQASMESEKDNTKIHHTEYALSVGSLEPRKNYETLIEAISHLSREDRVQTIIVGNGKANYKRSLQTLIDEKHLSKWISIQSNISNSELMDLYKGAKMSIFPSNYEGHGLPITEALLYSIPVISSETSSMKEAGGPNTIYFNPNRPTELAEAIATLNKDPRLQIKMQEMGRQYALNTFDPRKIIDQLMVVYKGS